MRLILATVAATAACAAPSSAHVVDSCRKPPCKRHVVKPFKAKLDAIAACESGYRWHIDGLFDGGLQFHPSTWTATGSTYRFAHWAPKLEQMYRGVLWARAIGWRWRSTAGWPVCGR